MRPLRAIATLVGSASFAFGSTACGPPMVRGELGRMDFGVRSLDDPHGVRAETNLAPGSTATIVVRARGNDEAPVSAAVSTNPSAVMADLDPELRVRAIAPGNSRVWVDVGALRDAIAFTVRPVADVEVTPGLPVPAGEPVAALLGEKTRLWVGVYDADGTPVVAPAALPLTVTPPGYAHAVQTRDETRSMTLVLDAPGRVHVAGESGTGAIVDVLRPEDVLGLAVELPRPIPRAGATPRGPSDFTLALELVVVTSNGAREVVVSDGARVTSRTPETCRGAPDATLAELERFLGTGVVLIEALKSGACQVDIDFAGRSTSFAGHVGPVGPAGDRDAAAFDPPDEPARASKDPRALLTTLDAWALFEAWERPRPRAPSASLGGARDEDRRREVGDRSDQQQ